MTEVNGSLRPQGASVPTEGVATAVRSPLIWAVGSWLSAALDDPKVCAEMKADIREWFDNGGHLRPDALTAMEPGEPIGDGRFMYRTTVMGERHIVEAASGFVRVKLPYNYAFTDNATQRRDAEKIVAALGASATPSQVGQTV